MDGQRLVFGRSAQKRIPTHGGERLRARIRGEKWRRLVVHAERISGKDRLGDGIGREEGAEANYLDHGGPERTPLCRCSSASRKVSVTDLWSLSVTLSSSSRPYLRYSARYSSTVMAASPI